MSEKLYMEHGGKKYVVSEAATAFYKQIRESLEAAGLAADVAAAKAWEALDGAVQSGVLLKKHAPKPYTPSFAELLQEHVDRALEDAKTPLAKAYATWRKAKTDLESLVADHDATPRYLGVKKDGLLFGFTVAKDGKVGQAWEAMQKANLEIASLVVKEANDLWPSVKGQFGNDKPEPPVIASHPTEDGISVAGSSGRRSGGSGDRLVYKIEKGPDGVVSVAVNGQIVASGRTRSEIEPDLKRHIESLGKTFYASQFRRKPEWPTE